MTAALLGLCCFYVRAEVMEPIEKHDLSIVHEK